ncbi:agmatinase [Streptomyces camponoticapitis]|uniref:Agmatinase n=1 Tax=Streptomyces camponoticapitis TaxID=1616125 RepID=A0ABQ2EL95_9ACTN|nr:agmatinase [Streptomyces camponoticapitis]GGK15492.1 agmatinase [Streptomyces camponoticapitis]
MTRVPDDNRHHRNPMRPNPAKGERREKDVAAERARLSGMRARRRLRDVPGTKRREAVERSLDLGLPSASSINDRDISLFSRGLDPMFAGINTFLKSPYVENIRDIGRFDVAVVGVPFDMGTTYRSGARFGPQAVRRISALYDSYSPDLGMDLLEELTIGDAGDIFVIPANIEKTFGQVDLGISHILDTGAFPVIIGGDHSIGYPDAKALAKHVDGRLGIVHFDRHIDTAVTTMDERMHTTHWSHATDLPNVPPANLVQIGIGGWIGNHSGVQVAEERDTTVITMFDVEELGIDHAVDIALEIAWKDADAVYLSFDIDVVDPGYAPGTGTPEPGGMSPREALKAVRKVAQEGLIGMDLVEIAPPYDVADTTSQLGARVVMDTLATLVENGHLGNRVSPERRAHDEARRDRDAGIGD